MDVSPAARVAFLAACAFALAIVLNALAGVVMAVLGFCLLILSTSARAPAFARFLTGLRLTAALIAAAMVAIMVPYSIVGQLPRAASGALPALAIALGVWHLPRKVPGTFLWVGIAVMGVGLVAGQYVIRAASGAGIDVVLLHESAASALARGDNIYGGAVAVPNGAPGAPPGSMIVGYPYPPIAAVAYAAATWIVGDPRWMNLLAWVAMVIALAAAARHQASMLPFLLVAALPGWPAMLQSGWTDMLSAALIAIAAASWANPVVSGVALGLALASKQYFALLLPLLFFHEESRSRRAPIALATAALMVLPPFLLAPGDAWRSMVLWHARTPPRPESVTIMGALAHVGIQWSPPAWLGLAIGPIVMIVMARRAQSAAGFWLATAAGLTAFFLFSSQAMPNYWYLIAVLTIAGALSPFER